MSRPIVGSRPDGILFDLDDTLVDHRGAVRDALARWATGWGVTDSPVVFEERWQELETTYYRRYQAGELSRWEQRRARIRAFLPRVVLDDGAAEAAFMDYWSAYEECWRAFDDARETLEWARAAGFAIGILTNGWLPDQRRKLERTGLLELGIPLIASSELAAAKPDPRAFNAACDLLGVDPGRCLMVGDSMENDVLGGRAAGLTAILLDRHDVHRRTTVPRIRSLRALRDLPPGA
jgi:putative hydrolase of the HAD superfamily